MSRLRVEGLAKRYRSRQIVKDLSIDVSSGEVVGLLGPNGAGKTTAFYMIVGLVPCDKGTIALDDHDLSRLPVHKRAEIINRMLHSNLFIVRELALLIKIPASFALMASASVRARSNYDRRAGRAPVHVEPTIAKPVVVEKKRALPVVHAPTSNAGAA